MRHIKEAPKILKRPKRIHRILRVKCESIVQVLLRETYSYAIERVKDLIEKGSRVILVHGCDILEISAALKLGLQELGSITIFDVLDILASQRKRAVLPEARIAFIRQVDKLPGEYIEGFLLFIDKLKRRGMIVILLAESLSRVDPTLLKISEHVEVRNPGPEKIKVWLNHILGEVSDELIEAFLGLSINQITFLIKKIVDNNLDPKNPETVKLFRRRYFGVTTIRQVTWNDLGGIEKIKELLFSRIILPYKKYELAKKLGYKLPKGILLVGPPGTGKTSIALALANELGWNFFELGIGKILSSSSIVGEGEREIMDIFERARKSAPAIILIDEIDGIGMIRGTDPNETWRAPLLLTMLSEIEGIREGEGVLVIATTNRPDRLDPALVRRFDLIIEVPLPDKKAREEIFKIHLRDAIENGLVTNDVNYRKLAEMTEGLSGAEIAHICEEAKAQALKENMPINMRILVSVIRTYIERKKKLTKSLTEWDIAPSFLFT